MELKHSLIECIFTELSCLTPWVSGSWYWHHSPTFPHDNLIPQATWKKVKMNFVAIHITSFYSFHLLEKLILKFGNYFSQMFLLSLTMQRLLAWRWEKLQKRVVTHKSALWYLFQSVLPLFIPNIWQSW